MGVIWIFWFATFSELYQDLSLLLAKPGICSTSKPMTFCFGCVTLPSFVFHTLLSLPRHLSFTLWWPLSWNSCPPKWLARCCLLCTQIPETYLRLYSLLHFKSHYSQKELLVADSKLHSEIPLDFKSVALTSYAPQTTIIHQTMPV